MLIVEHGEHYRVADYRPTNWESFRKTGSIFHETYHGHSLILQLQVTQGSQLNGKPWALPPRLGRVTDQFFDKTKPTKPAYSANRSKTSVNRIGSVDLKTANVAFF
jgi:hypothetical protein